MTQTSSKGIALTLILLLFINIGSFSQTNAFSYLTWYDDHEWQAEVVKTFELRDAMPHIRFLHSQVSGKGFEQVHYDDHINYICDDGSRWQATIHYDSGSGTFYFTHCKEGSEECHDDVVMNYRNISGENRQLTIENCSLAEFKSQSKHIRINSKLLGRWEETNTKTDDKNAVYLSWKTGEHCGCSTAGGGFKHYLNNATGNKYKITVQATTNATPSHISTHDYLIKPGEEIYIGCSQAESQGCFSVDYAIIAAIKQ